MNKSKTWLLLAAIALLAALGLNSCMTVQLSNMKDDELVAAGVEQWNTKGPEEARPYWANIKDEALKTRYLGYIEEKAGIEAAAEALLALPADDGFVVSFEAFAIRFNAFPKSLTISDAFKPGLRPQTVEVVKARVRAGRIDEARSFAESANAFLGASDVYDPFLKESESLANIQAQEKDAEKLLSKARSTADFDDKIRAYETAIAAYGKVDSAAIDEIKLAGLPEDAPLAVFQGTIRKKRSAATVEMEKALRQRQASFNERIGEIFARTPEGDQLGNMTPEDLLKFHEKIRTDINDAYTELTAFAAKYPKVIDKGMIAEVESEKTNLDTRITQITDEIRRIKEEAQRNRLIAEEYESRGKVALPLMIGLFNPQPGSAAESKKSRPAKMKGTVNGEADYWWGMISIDAGSKDDLVVTMGDGKEIQVYADNPKKGAVPDRMKNVVSMKDKVGKSWPVINAAKHLVNNRYYLQIKKNGTAAYTGEVVIYKSFIARMR